MGTVDLPHPRRRVAARASATHHEVFVADGEPVAVRLTRDVSFAPDRWQRLKLRHDSGRVAELSWEHLPGPWHRRRLTGPECRLRAEGR